MNISISTFITTFIFGAAMIILLALLLRNKATYSHLGLRFLTLFSWIVLIRLLLPLEFLSFTILVPSTIVMPVVRDILLYNVFSLWGYDITILMIMIFIWFWGVILYNYKLFKAYRSLSNLSSLPETDNPIVRSLLNKVKEENGIQEEIRLIQNSYITVPSIAGIRNAAILLPDDAFSEQDLLCIFHHELNHYKHHDNLSKLILEIVNSFYWWNPLFYLLKAQIATIFEFRADTDSINEMQISPITYMKCLLQIYEKQLVNNTPTISAAFCATNQQSMLQRFTYMAKTSDRHREHIVLVLAACLCLLMGSFSLIFEAHSISPEQAKDTYSLDDTDSAWILYNSQKKYILYIDGKARSEISKPNEEPFCNLQRYYSEKEMP